MIVTQQVLAECFGITKRRVQQLQTEGVIHRDIEHNGYDLAECNRAYLDYKINSETGRKTAISKEQMQAEHEKVKMDISKLKLKRLRREVLDVEDVETFLTDMLIRFRNSILSLPAKIVMAISGEEMNRAIEIVTGLLEGALEELSEYDPEVIDQGTNLGDYEDNDEEEEDEG